MKLNLYGVFFIMAFEIIFCICVVFTSLDDHLCVFQIIYKCKALKEKLKEDECMS